MPVFPMRTRVGMVLLACIALLSCCKLLLEAWGQYAAVAGQPASMTAFVARFDELRKALPSEGVLGYITDRVRDPNAALAEYYVTEFALAPVLVVNSWNEKFVVGNFHRAVEPSDLQPKGLEFVHDYGSGVQLLRNPTR